MLLTIQDKLFANQSPKVLPDSITAQYDAQEMIKQMNDSVARGETTFKRPEGTDRKYLHIKDVKKVLFTRNPDKSEAGINPEPASTMRFVNRRAS
jgi:hypothetical protein